MAQQPTHTITDYDSKLQFAIMLSGPTYNPKGYESPVYAVWDIALNDLVVATHNCFVHPQLQVTHKQNMDQDIPRECSRIPDFGVLLKRDEKLLKTYLLLIENKPLPFEKKDGVTHGLKGDKLTQWIRRNANKSPIIAQIRNQAKFIFSKSSQKKIYSILTFGEYWCYTFFEKETTSGFYPPNQMSASMDPGSILWGDIYKLGTPESDQMLSRLMTTSANESGWDTNQNSL